MNFKGFICEKVDQVLLSDGKEYLLDNYSLLEHESFNVIKPIHRYKHGYIGTVTREGAWKITNNKVQLIDIFGLKKKYNQFDADKGVNVLRVAEQRDNLLIYLSVSRRSKKFSLLIREAGI